MKIHAKILSIITVLLLVSCSNRQNQNPTEKSIRLHDEKSAIVYDTLLKNYFEKNNYTQFTPTEQEIKKVDAILQKAIKKGEFDFIKKPVSEMIYEYYRQYICYIDENGQKIIRINAFCKNRLMPSEENGEIVWKPLDWKNKILIVLDGGSCYWTIFINLTKNEYFDLTVNGEA